MKFPLMIFMVKFVKHTLIKRGANQSIKLPIITLDFWKEWKVNSNQLLQNSTILKIWENYQEFSKEYSTLIDRASPNQIVDIK